MNITFKSLSGSGFLSLGEFSVDLSEQGFVLVQGRNNESSVPQSNGSGKSSIFDAIFWTITGETLRGATDVVNEHMKSSGCLCSLKFLIDGTEYEIVRSKSHSVKGTCCEFYENGELLSDQVKKSQEMISKTIPSASSEILGSIVLLGQGLPYKFSSLSPSRRKDLLETMSGSSSQIDKVKWQLDCLEEEHSKFTRDATTKIAQLNADNHSSVTTRESLVAQQESVKDPQTVKNEINRLQDEIVNFTNACSDAQTLEESLRSQQTPIITAIDNLRTYISDQKAQRRQLVESLSQLKLGVCPTCNRPYDVTEEMTARKVDTESRIQQIDATIVQLDIKLNDMVAKSNEISQRVSEQHNLVTGYNYKISSHHQEVMRLQSSLGLSEDIQSKIDEIDRMTKERNIELVELHKVIEERQELLECIGYLKRQLSRDFKGYMLEEVIKFMSSRAEYYSEFLFTTSSRVSIELSGNKILILVGGRLYENLSGGERQRVDLAVQFALRDMLVITSGFSCNLLVLDEAFDNLDAQGSESLIRLVTTEFSDIDSVYIVTHHSQIAIPYDKGLTVVKGQDGISRIEE